MKKVLNRRTFLAHGAKFTEALTLLIEASKGSPYKYRILSSHFGTFDTIVLEVEFDSVSQMEEVWAAIEAGPTMGDFLRQWHEAIVPGGTNEVWWIEAEG